MRCFHNLRFTVFTCFHILFIIRLTLMMQM
nr:MAG TPA: hypothetical protein [Caudoviricetes sp.]